jgi:hypothetical protein
LALREYFKKITWPFFLTSFLICLLIDIRHTWYLVWGWVWVHGYRLTQWSLFFQLVSKKILHYVVHLVALPSSFNPWFVTLHLLVAFKSYGDPPFSLCPWWVKMAFHGVAWDVFAFIVRDAVDLCFSTTCLSIFASMGWHCDFGGWCPNVS